MEFEVRNSRKLRLRKMGKLTHGNHGYQHLTGPSIEAVLRDRQKS